MNYEKKYKNLVKAIEEFRNLNRHDEGIRNWVNDNVPELVEIEDERIRKALLELFNNVDKKDWRGIPNEKIVDWLERQGEKPQGKTALEAIKEEKVDNANKVESKFHEGDWIFHQGTENIYKVVAVIDNQYQLKYGDTYTIQKCDDVDRHARLLDASKDLR